MKILLVGGTFNDESGKPSGVIRKMNYFLRENKHICDCCNGGYFNHLDNIAKTVTVCDYDVVMWMPNIPNDKGKELRNIKAINQKVLLVTSKRNTYVNGAYEYTLPEMVNHALGVKANLFIEFCKGEDGAVRSALYDPLAVEYCSMTDNISYLMTSLCERLEFLKNGVTRQSSILSVPDEPMVVPDKRDFFEYVKTVAERFHELIQPPKEVTRFLGNSSFRCDKGFPSFRHDNLIFVSKRNINKRYIGHDGFVPVELKDGQLYCYAKHKPSVDSPIQVRLFDFFENINYMVHAHVYVENAPMTDYPIPCGAIEEVKEVIKAMKGDYKATRLAVNLRGHGCLVGGYTMDYFLDPVYGFKFFARPMPEPYKGNY